MQQMIALRKRLAEVISALEKDESYYKELEVRLQMPRWRHTKYVEATMMGVNNRMIAARATRDALVNELNATIDTYVCGSIDSRLSWQEKYDCMLEGELKKWDTQIITLEGELKKRDKQIAAVQGELTAVQGELAAVQGELTAVQAELAAVQGELAERDTPIAAVQEHCIVSENDKAESCKLAADIVSVFLVLFISLLIIRVYHTSPRMQLQLDINPYKN
jgi:chromosome segregation ATPase